MINEFAIWIDIQFAGMKIATFRSIVSHKQYNNNNNKNSKYNKQTKSARTKSKNRVRIRIISK